jgi:hypothetical protein
MAKIPGDSTSYWESQSPEQLDAFLQAAKKKRGAAQDAKLPFNEPLSAGDIAYWGCLASWSPPEAAALTLGKDPRKADEESLLAAAEISPLAKSYIRLRDRVLRAVQAGELSSPITPPKFIQWAQREGISLAKDLATAVTKRFGKIEDWKKIREDNERLNRRVSELEAVLSAPDAGGTDVQSDRPLQTRERDSLLLIMITCAINSGHQPRARSDFARRISEQLEQLGMRLCEDTVRNHLTTAAELLPGDWQEKIAVEKRKTGRGR